MAAGLPSLDRRPGGVQPAGGTEEGAKAAAPEIQGTNRPEAMGALPAPPKQPARPPCHPPPPQLDPEQGAAEAPSLLRLSSELGLSQLGRAAAAYCAQHWEAASRGEGYARLGRAEVDAVARELARDVAEARGGGALVVVCAGPRFGGRRPGCPAAGVHGYGRAAPLAAPPSTIRAVTAPHPPDPPPPAWPPDAVSPGRPGATRGLPPADGGAAPARPPLLSAGVPSRGARGGAFGGGGRRRRCGWRLRGSRLARSELRPNGPRVCMYER